MSYRRPALKHNGIVAGAFTVGESAHCLGSLVLEACEQFVELLHAKRLEEPFPV